MESPPGIIETIIETTESYAKTSYQLAKLHVQEFLTTILSKLILRLSLICIFLFFILLFNIGIALWLGDLVGKNYYGFFIVAGFYLILGIIVNVFLKERIKKSMANLIVNLSHH